jgi:hypothetical protein
MTLNPSRTIPATRRSGILLRAVLLTGCLLLFKGLCFAQAENVPPIASKPSAEKPITVDERSELLKLIRSLQERLDKLEAAQSSSSASAGPTDTTAAADIAASLTTPAATNVPNPAPPTQQPKPDADADSSYGRYTPNFGFKVVNTESGDMNISIYTYARYLNQLGLASSYQDAFGNTKSVQERQDFQLTKVQIKFLGWILDPKLRYFLYAWTSNATQGQGAQVVVAGNVGYTFNKYATLSAGITSLPGVRTTEGNFPFWLSVDSRHIADEFFRPSYTSGIWVKGNIAKRLRYQAMLGNNLSTLGVSASRLDKGFNTLSTTLVWNPTGDFKEVYGDFESSKEATTRLAAHFSRSDENRESQPSNDSFENTQLRLSDGTVIFTPNLFGPGVTITDATYKMFDVDGSLKYRGFALEGEYYWRWLNNFKGTGVAVVPDLFDHGFQLQASGMVIPRILQAYGGTSRINGQYGDPWDVRAGINWFPWKNKVVRWNTEWLYLRNSPVGYSSVPFAIGGRGSIFHSTLELAF